MFYKLLSKLLDYPDAALVAALPDLRGEIKRGFEAAEWLVLDRFLNHLASLNLTELQAAYVQTFDLTPEHALHLTHHLFGDDKNRGPALIDLTDSTRNTAWRCGPIMGWQITGRKRRIRRRGASNELPDYLPLVLEFAAMLETDEARMFLSQWAKVLNQLASNLEEAEAPTPPHPPRRTTQPAGQGCGVSLGER